MPSWCSVKRAAAAAVADDDNIDYNEMSTTFYSLGLDNWSSSYKGKFYITWQKTLLTLHLTASWTHILLMFAFFKLSFCPRNSLAQFDKSIQRQASRVGLPAVLSAAAPKVARHPQHHRHCPQGDLPRCLLLRRVDYVGASSQQCWTSCTTRPQWKWYSSSQR